MNIISYLIDMIFRELIRRIDSVRIDPYSESYIIMT